MVITQKSWHTRVGILRYIAQVVRLQHFGPALNGRNEQFIQLLLRWKFEWILDKISI